MKEILTPMKHAIVVHAERARGKDKAILPRGDSDEIASKFSRKKSTIKKILKEYKDSDELSSSLKKKQAKCDRKSVSTIGVAYEIERIVQEWADYHAFLSHSQLKAELEEVGIFVDGKTVGSFFKKMK